MLNPPGLSGEPGLGSARASVCGTDNRTTHAFFVSAYQVKSLIRYHHDMEKYCATSDVKQIGEANITPSCAGLTTNVLPEVQQPIKPMNSQTGVSTNCALTANINERSIEDKDLPHWYALRTTYGREKKAFDYLVSKHVMAFYPTLKRVKIVDGKRITTDESRIPNIFFAYSTEEELKTFVYDNVNLPYSSFGFRIQAV